ncbi:hypothetical protein, partial [Actinoallomurus acaciae]
AGPDPYTPRADEEGDGHRPADETPDAKPPRTRRTPPGDVKVAGAPLNPGDRDRPDSWSTMPNPTQDEPETASGEDTDAGTATAGDPARDDAAEDTVTDRRKDRSPRGPFDPVDGNGTDGGDTTAPDEPYGDEPARP